jgi:hypothetical protein
MPLRVEEKEIEGVFETNITVLKATFNAEKINAKLFMASSFCALKLYKSLFTNKRGWDRVVWETL